MCHTISTAAHVKPVWPIKKVVNHNAISQDRPCCMSLEGQHSLECHADDHPSINFKSVQLHPAFLAARVEKTLLS